MKHDSVFTQPSTNVNCSNFSNRLWTLQYLVQQAGPSIERTGQSSRLFTNELTANPHHFDDDAQATCRLWTITAATVATKRHRLIYHNSFQARFRTARNFINNWTHHAPRLLTVLRHFDYARTIGSTCRHRKFCRSNDPSIKRPVDQTIR